MIRLFTFVLMAATWLLATDANACQRCGLFGRLCRFSHSYYAPAVAYVPQATTQNFIFNNSYPVAALGNSVYGYNLLAQPVDVPLVLDRHARLNDSLIVATNAAVNGYNANVQGTLALVDGIDRRTKNLAALQAFMGTSPAQPQSFSLRVTVGPDGQPKVEQLNAEGQPCQDGKCAPGENVPPSPVQAPKPLQNTDDGGLQGSLRMRAPASTVSLHACGKCHDGSGKNRTPAGLVINDQAILTPDQRELAIEKIRTGEMPPPNSGFTLSSAQKYALMASVAQLAR